MHHRQTMGIYVHIPFCVKKCAYCDFLSAPATKQVQEQYLHRLIEEIQNKATPQYVVHTIYFGGGTPTAVEATLLCQVLEAILQHFDVASDAEISLECNPGTASLEALQQYRAAGFNRISIGLQSTHDTLLQLLGRIHQYAQFQETYAWARQAGFANINVDLMSALPTQTLSQYEESLHKVCQLGPEHISAYSLIVEEGTPFYEMELQLPDEDLDRLMYERTEEILKDYGYDRYEISNYAKEGKACRHNLCYWYRDAYMGFGIGAASFYEHTRYKNQSSLEQYLMGDFIYEEKEALTEREEMEEFFFLGLRTVHGVSQTDFDARFGPDRYRQFEGIIERNKKDGLLSQDGDRLSLTKRGLDVSNYVFVQFLKD